MRMLSTFVVVLSSALLFAGCSSVKLSDKPPVEERSGNASNAGADSRTVSTVNANSATDPLNDPKGVLVKRSIYFDLDSYVIMVVFLLVFVVFVCFLSVFFFRKIIIQGFSVVCGG